MSSNLLLVLQSQLALACLIMLFACQPCSAQDDVEHKQRQARAKDAEREAKKENSYKGSDKAINHSGKNTNDVRVGEQKVGRDPAEKESKRMNAYSGDAKAKSSDPSKNSSRKISQYTGDVAIPKSRQQLPKHDSYVPLPTNQAYITSQKIKKYTGDLTPRKLKAQAPRNEATYVASDGKQQRETDKKISAYSGDVVVNQSNIRHEDKKRAAYSGDIVVNKSKIRAGDKERAEYSGDIVVNQSKIRAADKERAEYSGDIVVDGNQNRINDKRRANYQGDLPNNYLEKRAAYREDKNRKIASYNGDLSVRALQSSARKVRIKQKKMANYEGDIVVKNFKKGMHPSAAYRGGTVKNSYAAKERYRKRILKKYGRTEGIEDANYMKQKYKKPKHDKKEADIWY